jgi:sulfopropanediol 3-dehydrogenase
MPQYLKRSTPQRPSQMREVRETVARILDEVERDGEAAVRRYSCELDGWEPDSFRVDAAEVARAEKEVDRALVEHIAFARDQVARFATLQRESMLDLECKTLAGVVLGHRHVPVASVGAYAPGGRYPLIASAIMTIVPAKVAGVERVVACAPPRRRVGGIHAPQLLAMRMAGADEIYCIGGAQAVAALAFGIEGLPGVHMIVGPGNVYVSEAKRQLFGTVGIDLLAGPTEVAILADSSADPDVVAVDLLAQAEHGPSSPVSLVTTSNELARAVEQSVVRRLESWPTADVAARAWTDAGMIVACESDEEMVLVCDALAPEHVQVMTSDPAWFRERLSAYGSLFLGASTTVAYGDKGVGTNHVLPTAGAARYTSGLWVGKFLRTLTWQQLTDEGARAVAPHVAAVCDAEGMHGHAISARLRAER